MHFHFHVQSILKTCDLKGGTIRMLEHICATVGTEVTVGAHCCINNGVGYHCCLCYSFRLWSKSAVTLSRVYELSNLLTSSPVIRREEHIWNFRVFHRVSTLFQSCYCFLSIHSFMTVYYDRCNDEMYKKRAIIFIQRLWSERSEWDVQKTGVSVWR
jgi:hypothetical protein